MQDPQTVARIRRGDGSALKRLFKSNFSNCYALAYRVTGSDESARACVQRAFENLWEERESIDPFNVIDLSLLREVFLASTAHRKENPSQIAVYSHDRQVLPSLVSELKDMDEVTRLVFLLWAADGFTYRQIARAVGLSEDAVKQKMGGALSRLETSVSLDEGV
jgi:DNA-directed RNA polymerase specialized sigma24 family protein